MIITKKRLRWMINYRGGMGNRIDAFDLMDFIENKGYLFEAWKKRNDQHKERN